LVAGDRDPIKGHDVVAGGVVVLDRDIPGTHGAVEDRVEGLGIDADDYLKKPCDFTELVARVRALARHRRGLDHREPVDLAAVVNDALDAHRPSAAARGLQVDAAIDGATVPGDARLIYRLAS
jgi:DNA-binding response OmpR family regulator